MIDLETLDRIPTWLAATLIAALTLSLLIGIPLARNAGARAARLARADQPPTRRPRNDTLALFAALAPSILVWLAVIGVSFIGLTGFAAEVMNWRHWTNILVPLSLDGISVSFGGWAFVAVKRHRHPGRAYKIVLAAATISSLLNFVHGKDEWSIWAGVYLAFLSFAGMVMFHEMLDQFMAGHHDEPALTTRYPRFGQRWLYAPWSTWCARRAWIVYPPTEGTRPTIPNALAHWTTVKQTARAERMHTYHLRAEEQHLRAQASPRARDGRRDRPASHKPTPPTTTPPARTAHHPQALEPVPSHVPPDTNPKQKRPDQPGDDREPPPPMSNAELNRAAEDLWIEAMQQGTDLSGTKLLTLFHERYPHHERRQRWAVHRRNAAQARLAHDLTTNTTVSL